MCGEEKPIEKFYWSVPSSTGKRWRRKQCGECQAERARQRKKNRRFTAQNYRCMDDPWEFYRPGIVMSKGDMIQTLKIGYMPPNSIWKHNQRGTRWRVVGNEEWWQIQELIGDRTAVECEKQRLALVRQPPRSG
jgi:hypothetical protein